MLFVFIELLYFLFNFSLLIIWLKMPTYKPKKSSKKAFFSVIIPVRNEAETILNLLKDLEKQTYPKEFFEVILTDDNSNDNTVEIAEKFKENTSISLIINKLFDVEQNESPKKRAINSSIKLAKGELITSTDGDCRVGENWLSTLNDFYQETDANLISAAVTFYEENNQNFWQKLFLKMQVIEFASLIGTGACSLYAGRPTMCNGANLSYKKKVFYEVGGFEGNEKLASGDDEFLMHKIAALNPEKVQFLKSNLTIVQTSGHSTFSAFYNQRKRWASKWKHYKNWQTIALAVFVFIANFTMIIAPILWGFGKLSNLEIVLILALKYSAEFVFLWLIIRYLAKKQFLFYIPIVQLFYPLYVSFFGLIAQRKGYEWKGRKLK